MVYLQNTALRSETEQYNLRQRIWKYSVFQFKKSLILILCTPISVQGGVQTVIYSNKTESTKSYRSVHNTAGNTWQETAN